MVSRVLVAMDDSEMAEQALEYALEAHPAAEITVLTAVGEPSTMFGEATAIALADDVEEAARDHAESVLDRAREIAGEANADLDTVAASGRQHGRFSTGPRSSIRSSSGATAAP